MTYIQEKQVALEAVTRAAKLCMAVRADMVGADSLQKDDKSPVTIADFGAQALVCQRLLAAFPQDAIVGEEDSSDLQKPENEAKLAQVTHYVQRFQPDATPPGGGPAQVPSPAADDGAVRMMRLAAQRAARVRAD